MKNYLIKNINYPIIDSHFNIIEKRSIEYKKNNIINKNIINIYLQYKNIYNNKLLNKITINSSLNNLFYKFYNIPNLLNFNEIKKYFIGFKIRTKKLSYSKQINTTRNSLIFSKNYNNQMVTDLSVFIKIYGFR
jgi:hypothetical protein